VTPRPAGAGALLYGPDSLLSGAAAQDLGGPNAAALAIGMINGLGSVGAVSHVPRSAVCATSLVGLAFALYAYTKVGGYSHGLNFAVMALVRRRSERAPSAIVPTTPPISNDVEKYPASPGAYCSTVSR
jgi:sugar phosphate permease